MTRLPTTRSATARRVARAALLSTPLLAVLLSGCDTVSGWFGKTPDAPLPGQRLSVLSTERKLTPDQRIADVPVTVPPVTANAAWAQAGGSPDHVGGNLALAASPAQVWRSDAGEGASGGRMILAAPVIADGRVFVLDANSNVTALNDRTGGRLWQVDTRPENERGEAGGGGVAYADGRLFASTGYGEVLALDPASGKVLWRKRIPGPARGAPTVSGGRVFALTLDNQMAALSADDGAELWTHQGILETAGLLGGASPAATAAVVVAPYSSGELYGIRPENGRVAWQESLAAIRRAGALTNLADIVGLPVIDRGIVFGISHSGRMMAVDERIGNAVWEADIGGVDTPWLAGDFLFVVTNDNELVAVTRQGGRVRWVAPLPRYEDPEDKSGPISWSGPVLAGGRLWVTGSNGQMLALDPTDGHTLRQYDLPSGTFLPPVVAGNTLYVLCEDGTLAAYR